MTEIPTGDLDWENAEVREPSTPGDEAAIRQALSECSCPEIHFVNRCDNCIALDAHDRLVAALAAAQRERDEAKRMLWQEEQAHDRTGAQVESLTRERDVAQEQRDNVMRRMVSERAQVESLRAALERYAQFPGREGRIAREALRVDPEAPPE